MSRAVMNEGVSTSGGPSTGRVPVAGPWITEREVRYAAEAAMGAWYDRAGEWPARFEAAFAAHTGRAHAASLPSCTSAIHLALAGLGVGPGDEVIVPESTWIASAAPIAYVGASPVFVDVERESWCLSPERLEEAISPRTKAIIVVDLYGNMPALREILDIAARHDLPVIEDAAEAVGSQYGGRPAGSFGRASVFSFHGSKTLTTGEGGMLVTDDRDLFERCLRLRDHGRVPGDRHFMNDEVAFKYKMSALQAALGLAQLERLEELVERKREIFGWYRERLAEVPGLTLNPEPANVRNSYWMSTVVLDERFGLDSAGVMAGLDERGIDSRPFFHPLSSIPAYRETDAAQGARERNPVAYALAHGAVNLPSALCLTQEQVAHVSDSLRAVLGVE